MKIRDTTTITWGSLATAESRELFPGIVARTLWTGSNHSKTIIVDFELCSEWNVINRHERGPKEVYVISGSLNDGVNDFEAGTFIHNPKKSFHIPQSEKGYRLFLFFPRD